MGQVPVEKHGSLKLWMGIIGAVAAVIGCMFLFIPVLWKPQLKTYLVGERDDKAMAAGMELILGSKPSWFDVKMTTDKVKRMECRTVTLRVDNLSSKAANNVKIRLRGEPNLFVNLSEDGFDPVMVDGKRWLQKEFSSLSPGDSRDLRLLLPVEFKSTQLHCQKMCDELGVESCKMEIRVAP